MTSPSPAVTAETLSLIAYQDVPVLTTELLATLYGTKPTNISTNFLSNAERFELGKHYFKLEGEELKEFKRLHRSSETASVEISPRVNALTLWTARGAARHAKILQTDQAWEVFEKLEDTYFERKETARPEPVPEPAPAVAPPVAAGPVVVMTPEQFMRFAAPQMGLTVLDRTPTPAPASAPRRPGKPKTKRRNRRMTEAEHAKILALYNQGLSKHAIAKEIGRATKCVDRSLERATQAEAPHA